MDLLQSWYQSLPNLSFPPCVCVWTHFVMSSSLRPMDYSSPGSSAHGTSQARILEWVAISYPGDLPNSGIEPSSLVSPALAGGFFTTELPSNPSLVLDIIQLLKVCIPRLQSSLIFLTTIFAKLLHSISSWVSWILVLEHPWHLYNIAQFYCNFRQLSSHLL